MHRCVTHAWMDAPIHPCMDGLSLPPRGRRVVRWMRGTDAREATGTAAAAIAADAAATVQPITSGAWRGGEYKISNPNIHSFIHSFVRSPTHSFIETTGGMEGRQRTEDRECVCGTTNNRVCVCVDGWIHTDTHTHTHTHITTKVGTTSHFAHSRCTNPQ
eukprot:GHVU01088442.1.p1 GENE.GHVU01088442.1~~GHVU01088442.1.p1  ORF type:complete len:160 (+),score=17.26 GHVU01088442.1:109-588(+)